MSTITREQLRERAREKVKSLEFSITQTAFADTRAELEEELELARIALASLEAEKCAEPVAFINGAWTLVYYRPPKELGLKIGDKLYTAPPAPVSVPDEIEPTVEAIKRVLPTSNPDEYAACIGADMWNACRAAMLQGADERHVVRSEHAEWSQSTFGDVGPVGPLKHLSKEALEAATEPGDLSEWADMQFLLWDAQRRAGITDEQITLAMIEKLEVNKARTWPEPKDGEPRLHIKAEPQQEVNP